MQTDVPSDYIVMVHDIKELYRQFQTVQNKNKAKTGATE